MRARAARLAIPAVLLAAGLAALPTLARAGDWVKLYNGQDLSGWHVESGQLSSWRANGELISCVSKNGGYLATDKEYGDFEFKVEYRIPPAGNTGIGLRFKPGTWPSTEGMEIQILDDPHPQYKNLDGKHRNGSIYAHVAPKSYPAKPPGEWNAYLIRCQGPKVQIRLNGVEIIDANLDELKDDVGKGKVGVGRRPRKGLIGLQSHGDPVDFRNIEVREL